MKQSNWRDYAPTSILFNGKLINCKTLMLFTKKKTLGKQHNSQQIVCLLLIKIHNPYMNFESFNSIKE